MKKFLIVLGILFLVLCVFVIYDTYSLPNIPMLSVEDTVVNVDKLFIYGTHLNMEGNYTFEDEPELVLYNGNFISYEINNFDKNFNLSQYINDGIYLDDIPTGNYYLFLRTKYVEDEVEKYRYYALKNNTEYKKTTYYTMSNHEKKISISNDDSYPTMMMNVIKIKNNDVYDIVIDPGHGGLDSGANKNGYSETDFTMNIATKIKDKLEKIGFKVKLTHEKGQLSNTEKLNEYGVHGRAIIPREVNAKYLFSIHLNSSNFHSVNGLEVYTAKNINYNFAKLLVNNITNAAGITYSNNKTNKIYNGIYTRNFTEEDVIDTVNDYKKRNLIPYDVTTNSSYYYMIRETGGIVTGAYVDNRNNEIVGNPYINSNVGTETYLLELGYLSNKYDVNNMVNNLDKFVEGIVNSINTLYQD